MFEVKNYIFDLDGTIINSAEEVLRCLQLSFEKEKYNVNPSRFTSDLIGPPIKKIIMNIAPEIDDDDLLNKIVSNFRDIYDNDDEDVSYLYDGIIDLLENLKLKNKNLFIATFKPSKPTYRIVKQFKLSYFKDVYCIDKFEKPMNKGEMIVDILKRYNLNKCETVMVGDSKSDMIAAKEADVTGIGVLWGYDKTQLKENCDITVENVKDIETVEI